MKIVIVLLLTLLLLSSCVSQPNISTPTVSEIPTSEESIVPTEPYSFSEVNSLFGPGPFSVNELVKVFGKPTSLYGYYSEADSKNGYFGLFVTYKDIYIDLAANNGEKLNFIIKDDSKPLYSYERYQVTDSDRDVRMKLRSISICVENFELPRNIKLGCSINELYDAYNGNQGKKSFCEHLSLISYKYGESGCITYCFDTESIYSTNELVEVLIEWYDTHNYEDVSTPSGLPGL